MSTVPAKEFVTLYSVHFAGLFGRNRSRKFWTSEAETVADASKADDKLWLGSLAQAELDKIKAKHGTVRVIRYLDCECLTSPDSRGNIVTSYIIPITQGQRVYTREIA